MKIAPKPRRNQPPHQRAPKMTDRSLGATLRDGNQRSYRINRDGSISFAPEILRERQ